MATHTALAQLHPAGALAEALLARPGGAWCREISISQPFQVFAQLTHGFLLSTQSSIERSGWSPPLAIAAARKAAERSSSAALGAREGVDSGQASSPPTSAAAA